MLDVYGFGERVKLLDGGRKLWEARKLPLTDKLPSFETPLIDLPKRDKTLRARLSHVLDFVEGRIDSKLVDSRSNDEYLGNIFAPEGVEELAIRADHIPGAENIPWATIVNEDGTYRSLEEIRKIYADEGIDGSKPIITYCRIGERSSHTWFALKRLRILDQIRQRSWRNGRQRERHGLAGQMSDVIVATLTPARGEGWPTPSNNGRRSKRYRE